MILGPTFGTVGCEFSAGHGHKGTIVTFNDFQIAHNKVVVERNATEPAVDPRSYP